VLVGQDAVCVYRRYGGEPGQLFFGVFDGHGQQGTSCAQFAKDKVCWASLALYIPDGGSLCCRGMPCEQCIYAQVPSLLLASPHFSSDPVEAFEEAMAECNEQLHASSIEDRLSGTTAIACLIRGRTIFVANVGDSR